MGMKRASCSRCQSDNAGFRFSRLEPDLVPTPRPLHNSRNLWITADYSKVKFWLTLGDYAIALQQDLLAVNRAVATAALATKVKTVGVHFACFHVIGEVERENIVAQ